MAPAKGIRGLKEKPEPLRALKQSYLWRVSKLLRAWEARWYIMNAEGFSYSKNPQGIALAKPVFDRGCFCAAQPEEKVATKDGLMMWGFTVMSTSGEKVTLYSDDRAVRDTWVRAINNNARSGQCPMFLDDSYIVDYDKPLGTGLFAIVLRGEQKATKLPVAIKVIKADAYKEYKDLVDREIMVWHAFGFHPNVVKLVEVLFSNKRVYFVAELLSGGNLVDSIAAGDSYTEADVARYVRQLLEGLRHCHSLGIAHLDLKPENIVLSSKSRDSPLKLIDFSLAAFFHTPTEPGGTPEFVAPELLIDPEYYADRGVGPSIDIWAVGIITFYLLSGKTPFHAGNLEDIIRRVKAGTWQFTPVDAWASISVHARDLVANMLQLDPSCRPIAQQLLAHPWLTATPAQHSKNQLYCAIREFKGEIQNSAENAHLRTSWIRRSGVMRGTLGAAVQPEGASEEDGGGASSFPVIQAAGMQDGRGSGGGLQDNPLLMNTKQVHAIKSPASTGGSAFPTIMAANNAVLGGAETISAHGEVSKEGQQLAMLQAQLNALKEKKGLMAGVAHHHAPAGGLNSERSSAQTSGSNARSTPQADLNSVAALSAMQEQLAHLQLQLQNKQRGLRTSGSVNHLDGEIQPVSGSIKAHDSISTALSYQSGPSTAPMSPALLP